MRAQQEEVSRGWAEGSSAPQVLLLALLLDPQGNHVFLRMLAGRCVDFGRQGGSAELFARAALAGETTLLALSSPGGRAAKKEKQSGGRFLGRIPAGRAPLPFSRALVPQTSFLGAPIAACLLTAAFLPLLPQRRRPSALIFRQKCCNN